MAHKFKKNKNIIVDFMPADFYKKPGIPVHYLNSKATS